MAALNIVVQTIRKGGLKAALFGAPILRTVGELDLGTTGPMRTTLKVHCLEMQRPGEPSVGLELVNKSLASYHMLPIRLTSEQTGALGELLSRAAAQASVVAKS